jgi:hypothetical protein
MIGASANQFQSRHPALPTPMPELNLVRRLCRHSRSGLAAVLGKLHGCTLRSIEQCSPQAYVPPADILYSRLRRDIMKIEARRLL